MHAVQQLLRQCMWSSCMLRSASKGMARNGCEACMMTSQTEIWSTMKTAAGEDGAVSTARGQGKLERGLSAPTERRGQSTTLLAHKLEPVRGWQTMT
eukprot:scaffold63431_cov18-Tisochrysis_lutea.AAC.6